MQTRDLKTILQKIVDAYNATHYATAPQPIKTLLIQIEGQFALIAMTQIGKDTIASLRAAQEIFLEEHISPAERDIIRLLFAAAIQQSTLLLETLPKEEAIKRREKIKADLIKKHKSELEAALNIMLNDHLESVVEPRHEDSIAGLLLDVRCPWDAKIINYIKQDFVAFVDVYILQIKKDLSPHDIKKVLHQAIELAFNLKVAGNAELDPVTEANYQYHVIRKIYRETFKLFKMYALSQPPHESKQATSTSTGKVANNLSISISTQPQHSKLGSASSNSSSTSDEKASPITLTQLLQKSGLASKDSLPNTIFFAELAAVITIHFRCDNPSNREQIIAKLKRLCNQGAHSVKFMPNAKAPEVTAGVLFDTMQELLVKHSKAKDILSVKTLLKSLTPADFVVKEIPPATALAKSAQALHDEYSKAKAKQEFDALKPIEGKTPDITQKLMYCAYTTFLDSQTQEGIILNFQSFLNALCYVAKEADPASLMAQIANKYIGEIYSNLCAFDSSLKSLEPEIALQTMAKQNLQTRQYAGGR